MRENCTNQYKILKIGTSWGGGETRFHGQNDFMDIWAFLQMNLGHFQGRENLKKPWGSFMARVFMGAEGSFSKRSPQNCSGEKVRGDLNRSGDVGRG